MCCFINEARKKMFIHLATSHTSSSTYFSFSFSLYLKKKKNNNNKKKFVPLQRAPQKRKIFFQV